MEEGVEAVGGEISHGVLARSGGMKMRAKDVTATDDYDYDHDDDHDLHRR
jgi:hypothetical protein